MEKEILSFYRKTSMYTNYGKYKDYFKSLPNDLKKLTKLINKQYIHRVVLTRSYIEGTTISKQYPWQNYRCHDDVLITVPAIVAELFRLDKRGFTDERKIKDKIVITCRYASILTASILKAKGYSARVRSGFTKYIKPGNYLDHWIVEYYDRKEKRWVIIDSDIIRNTHIFEDYTNIDIEREYFYTASDAWLDARSGKVNLDIFVHGNCIKGMSMLARTLFYDLHALMNDEISYMFFPTYLDTDKEFFELTINQLKELDDLALLLKDPDANFDKIKYLFDNNKKYRILNSPLVGDKNHLEIKRLHM